MKKEIHFYYKYDSNFVERKYTSIYINICEYRTVMNTHTHSHMCYCIKSGEKQLE